MHFHVSFCLQLFAVFARLVAKLPRPGDSEATFAVFEEAIPLSALPKNTTSELAGLSSH